MMGVRSRIEAVMRYRLCGGHASASCLASVRAIVSVCAAVIPRWLVSYPYPQV